MAKIKQLKDKSGTEQIFPKTKTQAIYNTDGTLLSETLDDLYGSLATIESSPTTTSHSVGEYILYQGQVYKVTSVIASGDSLVVGTNISAVNLGNQIDMLNGQVSTLNSKIINYSDNIKMKYFIKSATVPNGSASAPSTAEIDISDQIPSGSTVCGAFVFLGSYLLPYVEAGSVKTWVYVVSNTMIRLANITTGWGTQTAYILIFYR